MYDNEPMATYIEKLWSLAKKPRLLASKLDASAVAVEASIIVTSFYPLCAHQASYVTHHGTASDRDQPPQWQ